MGFGAAGNIRIFSGADGSLRHEIVSGVTTGVSLVLSDFDYDGHPDLLWGWKNTDSYWTGGGVYKGSTFEYLGDWGIDNDHWRRSTGTRA